VPRHKHQPGSGRHSSGGQLVSAGLDSVRQLLLPRPKRVRLPRLRLRLRPHRRQARIRARNHHIAQTCTDKNCCPHKLNWCSPKLRTPSCTPEAISADRCFDLDKLAAQVRQARTPIADQQKGGGPSFICSCRIVSPLPPAACHWGGHKTFCFRTRRPVSEWQYVCGLGGYRRPPQGNPSIPL